MTQAVDQQIESLEIVAAKESAQVSAALQGVGQPFRSNYAGVTATTNKLRELSVAQAKVIRDLETEAEQLEAQGFNEASRVRSTRAAEVRQAAEAAITQISADAHVYVDLAEAGLKSSVVPAPAKDATARQLARAEVDAAIGAGGLAAIAPLAKLAATDDPALSGEAMSDYSVRRLTAGLDQRAAVEVVGAYRATALSLILDQPQHKPTANALAALPRGRGAIDATRQAALLRVRSR